MRTACSINVKLFVNQDKAMIQKLVSVFNAQMEQFQRQILVFIIISAIQATLMIHLANK